MTVGRPVHRAVDVVDSRVPVSTSHVTSNAQRRPRTHCVRDRKRQVRQTVIDCTKGSDLNERSGTAGLCRQRCPAGCGRSPFRLLNARRRQIGLSLGKHQRWNSASGPASTSTSGSSRRSLLVSSATRAWTRLASSGSTGSAHPSQTLTFDTPVMVGRFPAVSGRDEMARPGGVAPRRRGGSYPHLDDTDAAPCNGRTNISEQRLVDSASVGWRSRRPRRWSPEVQRAAA